MNQGEQQPDGGGFSRAVWADKPKDFSFFNLKRDIHNSAGFAVVLGKSIYFDDTHRYSKEK